MRMFDGQVRPPRMLDTSRFKEESSIVGSFGSSRYKFSGADGGNKITKGSMTILKGEQTTNLYMLTGNIIVGDASTAIEKEDTTSFGTCILDT